VDKPVDKPVETVDNHSASVDNHVDNSFPHPHPQATCGQPCGELPSPVDNFSPPVEKPVDNRKLSTACGKTCGWRPCVPSSFLGCTAAACG